MHYRPPQSNFRGGGHVPRVPRGIYAYGVGSVKYVPQACGKLTTGMSVRYRFVR